MDEFSPLQLVTDFVTLLSTYPQGFMVILEPYNPAAALHTARDPVLQLTCMGRRHGVVLAHRVLCVSVTFALVRDLRTLHAAFSALASPRATVYPSLVLADASIAAAPVFERFRSVILTSGTLSPLDMYPKMLRFRPGVSKSFNITLARQCICPVVVARGADQVCGV